jgi:hypothetical protein
MDIIYTSHLEFRLKERNIPYEIPRRIFDESNDCYYDRITEHYIALHKIEFKGKIRNMSLTFDWQDNKIELITIHPISQNQKQSRIDSGRWVKI